MWKRSGRKKHQRKKVKLKRIRRGNESLSSQMKSINCGVGLGTEAGASIPSRLSRIGMGCDINWIERVKVRARHGRRHGGSRVWVGRLNADYDISYTTQTNVTSSLRILHASI